MTTPVAVKPPLESGDRLTQAEFHRRYCLHPEIKRAELVEGVVYLATPVGPAHAAAHLRISAWLGAYIALHQGVQAFDNGTVLLDSDNEVQPDAALVRQGPDGPQITEHHILGAPQLVVEIALSSASYALHDKMRAYRRNGIQEYIVWRVVDGAVDWFRLHEGEYRRVEPDANGMIESAIFPGLRLDVPKMLAGDLAGVLAALSR